VILEATITQRFWKQFLPGQQWWFCNQTDHSNLVGCKWSEHPLHIHPPAWPMYIHIPLHPRV